jgi:hypothetical protein
MTTTVHLENGDTLTLKLDTALFAMRVREVARETGWELVSARDLKPGYAAYAFRAPDGSLRFLDGQVEDLALRSTSRIRSDFSDTITYSPARIVELAIRAVLVSEPGSLRELHYRFVIEEAACHIQ